MPQTFWYLTVQTTEGSNAAKANMFPSFYSTLLNVMILIGMYMTMMK